MMATTGSVRGSHNGTIGKFTNCIIGCHLYHLYHWKPDNHERFSAVNGTIGANGTIGVNVGTCTHGTKLESPMVSTVIYNQYTQIVFHAFYFFNVYILVFL